MPVPSTDCLLPRGGPQELDVVESWTRLSKASSPYGTREYVAVRNMHCVAFCSYVPGHWGFEILVLKETASIWVAWPLGSCLLSLGNWSSMCSGLRSWEDSSLKYLLELISQGARMLSGDTEMKAVKNLWDYHHMGTSWHTWIPGSLFACFQYPPWKTF